MSSGPARRASQWKPLPCVKRSGWRGISYPALQSLPPLTSWRSSMGKPGSDAQPNVASVTFLTLGVMIYVAGLP